MDTLGWFFATQETEWLRLFFSVNLFLHHHRLQIRAKGLKLWMGIIWLVFSSPEPRRSRMLGHNH
jgi:hypothetical protein